MQSKLFKGERYEDQRGRLYFNNNFDSSIVKRIYFIENINVNFIRGWQGHKIEQRWFSAVCGSFKIELIKDTLAAKELYIGRYYVDRKKWIAAINRFKNVVNNYETTIYVEEALHRLVEIYYILGLEDESKKYANLLGYNYQTSKWYEKSYSVFNQNYEISKIKKEENIILRKFKSLFE